MICRTKTLPLSVTGLCRPQTFAFQIIDCFINRYVVLNASVYLPWSHVQHIRSCCFALHRVSSTSGSQLGTKFVSRRRQRCLENCILNVTPNKLSIFVLKSTNSRDSFIDSCHLEPRDQCRITITTEKIANENIQTFGFNGR